MTIAQLSRPGTARKKIAVIGSGPTGLNCAVYLRKKCKTVTVLE